MQTSNWPVPVAGGVGGVPTGAAQHTICHDDCANPDTQCSGAARDGCSNSGYVYADADSYADANGDGYTHIDSDTHPNTHFNAFRHVYAERNTGDRYAADR